MGKPVRVGGQITHAAEARVPRRTLCAAAAASTYGERADKQCLSLHCNLAVLVVGNGSPSRESRKAERLPYGSGAAGSDP